MPLSGSVSKHLSAYRSNAGQIDLDGSLGDSYSTKRSLSGAVSFAGELIGEIPGILRETLNGSLSFSGLLSDINSFSRSIAGAIGFYGGVAYKVNGEIIGSIINTIFNIGRAGIAFMKGIFKIG